MIDRRKLLSDLQHILETIEADLLDRSESAEVPHVGLALLDEYRAAQQAKRTAQSFEEWRSDAITQAAAAWVLSVVFVRFLEDNELVETPRIAGPGDRLKRARDEHELYFRSNPTLNDRDYLLNVFDGLTKHAATKDVFGRNNPIRQLPNWLSGDAAGALITFFQRIDADTGHLVHDFTDPAWDTRFLGDLYQDLSEAARKKYALLQTPVFVEEFILDRTLDPAIEEFGLARPGYERRLEPDGRLHRDDRFLMIDPACGSGHFLLGSFARLVELWLKKEPGSRTSVLVQRALDSIHGVDLNPYAIAIARFRLLLAALKESGVHRLSDAPGFVLHLACGDSLLHGSVKKTQGHLGEMDPLTHVYQPEDRDLLNRLLQPSSYHAVVANPPYITPKDSSLNQEYRDRYVTCHRQYSLAVPFLERIVSLAGPGGFTGQITANSFMKREFGKKLIESFFPRVDLTHVIDTSGAYIPGHGTPTVILLLRNRKPVERTLRTVLGIRGEPATPLDPAKGLVWSSIVAQIDVAGSQSEFVSVGDSQRGTFHKHPWSIGGGGAAELRELLENHASGSLESQIADIGRTTHTGEDDVFYLPPATSRTCRFTEFAVPLVIGEGIRDWQLEYGLITLFPYDKQTAEPVTLNAPQWINHLWRYRRTLKDRMDFGNYIEDRGLRWFDHSMFFPARFRNPLSITFAFVATHNHFVLDRGGKVFNRSAPVIKLPADATEDDHLALLGLLNSSTACFWMKQVFYPKASATGDISTEKGKPESNRYEFAGTGLERFPIPFATVPQVRSQVVWITRELDKIASLVALALPPKILENWKPGDTSNLHALLAQGNSEYSVLQKRKMVALQEELDWEVYLAFGLASQGADASVIETEQGIRPDDRPFACSESEVGASLPPEVRATYRSRKAETRSSNWLGLIEDPVHKRPWWGRQGVYGRLAQDYAGWTTDSLRSWLLDRLESYLDFDGRMNDDGRPTATLPMALVSVGRLADLARQDAAFHEVGALYRDDEAFDVTRLVAELVESESVPLLPILRYKPTGLRKRVAWETTWDLQRLEDSIEARARLQKGQPGYLNESDAAALREERVGTIPVPPKYTSADFLKGDFWRLRGKLDVPKERWVSFPHGEGEDGTLMVAWAGYDHLQLARAISSHYVDVQERLGGRDDPRLVPLLACVIELLPWLGQWHNDVDPEFGMPMGDYFAGFVQEESRNLGLTLDEIRAWQPPQKTRGRGRKASKTKTPELEDEEI